MRIYTPNKVKNITTGKYHTHPCEVWKSAIADEWRLSVPVRPTLTGPVRLSLCFWLARPKSHFTKKGLRSGAPFWSAKKPDADNFAKAVMDCLTKLRVWEDDDQVCSLTVEKCYSSDGVTGCKIRLYAL